MATVDRTASGVRRDLNEFAQTHGLMLPNSDCLDAHCARYVALGHCPCVEERESCPCDEVLSDVERMGRCECGILIDPARIHLLKCQQGER